jgi:hypothetical protein
MATDKTKRISMDTQLAASMANDAYTTYGYCNFIAIRSNSVKPSAGGEIHLILETNAQANAAALTTSGYGTAPAGSRIYCTQAGVGGNDICGFIKEGAGANTWAAITTGSQG